MPSIGIDELLLSQHIVWEDRKASNGPSKQSFGFQLDAEYSPSSSTPHYSATQGHPGNYSSRHLSSARSHYSMIGSPDYVPKLRLDLGGGPFHCADDAALGSDYVLWGATPMPQGAAARQRRCDAALVIVRREDGTRGRQQQGVLLPFRLG
eukprot:6853981-Prymnesium_polylepis.1